MPTVTSTATARASEAHIPHNNPCGQCGKPIGTPSWWESSERCMAYVWRCEACDYEFTSLVFYPKADERPLAA